MKKVNLKQKLMNLENNFKNQVKLQLIQSVSIDSFDLYENQFFILNKKQTEMKFS